jgi:hypothetical protein
MCLTLFPRTRGNTLSYEELKLIYAMVCKIKVSPVKLLVDYWFNSIENQFTSHHSLLVEIYYYSYS